MLTINTTDSGRWFKPGETIEGEVSWHLDDDAGAIEIRLFWYTDGKGSQDVEVNAEGRILNVLNVTAPQPGYDLVLGLDIELQRLAERVNGLAALKDGRLIFAERGAGQSPAGRALAALPLHPRLAHMLVTGGRAAAPLAALMADRDVLKGAPVDLTLRAEAVRDPKAFAARRGHEPRLAGRLGSRGPGAPARRRGECDIRRLR